MTHRYTLPAALLLAFAPAARAVDPSELKPGLVATYHDGGTAAVVRLEPTVAVTLGEKETAHPRLGGTTSVEWAGQINVVRAGKYTFAAAVEGGTLAVRVGGADVLTGAAVTLAGGIQPFEAAFRRAAGPAARVELRWEGPGFRMEPVPHMFFGHLPAQRPPAFAADAASEHGRLRFEEMACARCHKPAADDAMAKTLVDRPGPNLTAVGKRAYAGWLDAWLADPKKHRPHTTMPKLFADTADGTAERYAVVSYLTALAGGPLDPVRPPLISKEYVKSTDAGKVLFHVTGCAACHQLPEAKKAARNDEEDEKAPLQPDDYYYAVGATAGSAAKYLLGAVGSKTKPETLAEYLKDPLKTAPAGRMPHMVLESKDALDLARYLCRTTDDAIDPKMPPAPATKPAGGSWAAWGKQLIVSKGCVNCHAVEDGGKPLAPAAAFPALADVRKADAGKGCLAAKPDAGKAPDYKLDARESGAVAAFLKTGLDGAGSTSPVHAARVSLKRFNCLNCHQRDGEGGIPLELAEQMRLMEKSENADDVRPPVLTGVGHKARTSWLAGVLTQGQRARPWMQLRMPQYGPANVGHLPTALAALEGTVPDDAVHKEPLTKPTIAAGRTVVGKSGMGCISCHDIAGIPNTGTRGPDLSTINQRVRYDWYVRWLNQPLRMAPGTRMPQAFIDGKSPLATILKGEGDAQAAAVWAYLSLGQGLPLPDGMEPPKGLTLAVKERPEVLRTFLKEGGNRAVAVGYPGGVSVAFAADECKLTYAWAGNFLDASPVWDKRGGNPAKLLGPKFWTAPAGHPWGLSPAGAAPPDFAARATNPAFGVPLPLEPPRVYPGPRAVAFDGYALDKYGVPTFRYHLTGPDGTGATLSVAETPGPLKSGIAPGVQRRFALDAATADQAWLLAGSTPKAPRLIGADLDLKAASPSAPATARVILPADGERVTVLELADAPPGTEWRFVPKPGGGWQAVVKLPPAAGPWKGTLVLHAWALPRDDEALLKGLAGQ